VVYLTFFKTIKRSQIIGTVYVILMQKFSINIWEQLRPEDEEVDEGPPVQSVANGEGEGLNSNAQTSDNQSRCSTASLDSNARTSDNHSRRNAPSLRSVQGTPNQSLKPATIPYCLRSKPSRARQAFERAPKSGRVATALKRKRGEQQNGKNEDECHLEDVEIIDLTSEWVMPEHTLRLTGDYSEVCQRYNSM
jgi:hypothetical protein